MFVHFAVFGGFENDLKYLTTFSSTTLWMRITKTMILQKKKLSKTKILVSNVRLDVLDKFIYEILSQKHSVDDFSPENFLLKKKTLSTCKGWDSK